MLESATNILAYLLLAGLLYVMAFLDERNRFMALVLGTILFPESVLFMQKPSVSPQLLFLYGFFFVEFYSHPMRFKQDFLAFPLKTVLLLILCSRAGTEFYNGSTSLKEIFAIVWNYVNLYGYLFAAFIAGRRVDVQGFGRSFLLPTAVICILTIFEGLLLVNIPYKIIASAFPINDGIYAAGSITTDSWRTRAFFTTKHPTTLGTLLMCLFVFYLSFLRGKKSWNFETISVFILLLLAMYICGSRTAMACAALGVAIFMYHKIPTILKLCIVGIFAYACYFSFNYVYELFDSRGQGSSISLRLDQLLFSYLEWQKSPIWGRGQGYIGQEILERDAYGGRVFNHEIGGLESIVFKMMIENGAVGLVMYFLLFVYLAIWFFLCRKSVNAVTGLAITIVSAAFFSLSGHIGNNTAFSFLFMGLLLGSEVADKKKASVEELATTNEIQGVSGTKAGPARKPVSLLTRQKS